MDVRALLAATPICDIHTHLFDPGMDDLLLSGIDELLTYHYHVAELFRARPDLDYQTFFEMPTAARADLVWQTLFVERAPVSEVGRGVVQMLAAFGIDPNEKSLRAARDWFSSRDLAQRVDLAFEHAGVRAAYMTNDPLDPAERATWDRGFERDPRFFAALRLDSALIDWPVAAPALRELGHDVDDALSQQTVDGVRRYLADWCRKMDAGYMAISLPPTFRHPDPHDPASHLIHRAVAPVAEELGIPVALMVGVRRQVNPRLGLAGDGVGASDVASLERLAHDHPNVRFLLTVLGREDQHALCVAARKFKNIVPFGCWWFVNNPGLITEITQMRLDMLGLSFVPQHSDCRVLEQLVFKWARSRDLVGAVLEERYADLDRLGCPRSEAQVRDDLARLFDGQIAVGR